MTRFPRIALALVLATASATSSLAAGSSAPYGYTPDPALQTETPVQLQARIRKACGAIQARIQNVSTGQVDRGCGCYAQQVMRSLDGAELAAYRTTGIFNDSARAKAIAAIDSCRLKRPV